MKWKNIIYIITIISPNEELSSVWWKKRNSLRRAALPSAV
jgi:hypothetical protein